jgi:DNA-binding SARP family transcriptional activator
LTVVDTSDSVAPASAKESRGVARGSFLRPMPVEVFEGTVGVAAAEPTAARVKHRDGGPVRAAPLSLQLLNGFRLARGGETIELPMSVQRVVVFLAIQSRAMLRPYVAGSLWLETSDERAGANLRSALWRLNRLGESVVDATSSALRLDDALEVDLRRHTALAHRLLAGDWDETHLDECSFCEDLLPDWYDDWLVIERERFHQLRLRTLELICERLTASGEYARALDVGLAAVAGEPLRESAHRALVRVHLAEGNCAEAQRQFDFYRRLLHDQLGLAPSAQMVELLH